MSEFIDHTTLSRMVETGVVHSAHVVGLPGGWAVVVKSEKHECLLVTKNTRIVRVWRRFETLVSCLKGIGLTQFEVDTSNFEQNNTSRAKRPDRAQALKKIHEATAYNKWFKEQVQASIVDPRPSIAHDQVKAKFAAKADALRQRMKG